MRDRLPSPGAVAAAVLLGAALVVTLFPFVYMVSLSLSSDVEVQRFPPPLIPAQARWSNFARVWQAVPLPRYLLNSLVVATAIACSTTLLGSMAGYAFAKLRFPFRDSLFWVVVGVSMMIPFFVRMIPLYIMESKLGWLNTYHGYIVPWLMNGYSVFLSRQAIKPIPGDFIDAARIDGASETLIYRRVILPLARPALVTVFLFTFVFQWNEVFWPLIVTDSIDMRTLPLGLLLFRKEYDFEWNLIAAGAFILFLPILALFLCSQRFFLKGMMHSGLKG
ncbi:MAG TPA: carbohydrate ABC transporter permease [Methylomirabilota bacterium]|nr:carbohydrate ABC transporter permease [Methylomirabilota bacterium]